MIQLFVCRYVEIIIVRVISLMSKNSLNTRKSRSLSLYWPLQSRIASKWQTRLYLAKFFKMPKLRCNYVKQRMPVNDKLDDFWLNFSRCLNSDATMWKAKNVVICLFLVWQAIQSFIVSDQVRLSGTSSEMLRNILARLAAIGTDYIQLNKFATHHRGHSAGLVLQAFLGALQNYLQCYRATVLSVEGLYGIAMP